MPQPLSTSSLPENDIAEFIMVVSTEDDYHASYHDFAEKVNRKLKAGYRLYGQPLNVNHSLCQAMVRPVGVPAGNETAMFSKNPSGYHR